MCIRDRDDIAAVESLIPNSALISFPPLQEITDAGLLEYLDMEQMYIDHVYANFDIKLIQKTGSHLAYDAMSVSYTHLRDHETVLDLVCRLLLEKKTKKTKKKNKTINNINKSTHY